MKRRSVLRSALACTAATLPVSAIAQTSAQQRSQIVLRAEPKPSDTAPYGAFASRETHGLLFLTNAYGYSYQIPADSYIEWHIDAENTQMKFRCVNSDQYRVKAFPCAVLGTMGGRYETSGNPQPLKGLENEFRMKGEGLQSPLFDLYPAQQQTGFPCKLNDLPKTDLTIKTRYSGNPTVNTFLDMYLHDVDNAQTASHASLLGDINAINSNRTKAYNINVWFQMPDQTNGNTGRPDGAWAGGKVMGVTRIGKRDFHVILKIETGGGNYFRYIALIPVEGTITTLSINEVMDWAKTSMRAILEGNNEARGMMAKADPRGFPAPRWPDNDMVLSGLHIGNEIWWSDPNGQEGVVDWPTLRVDVDGIGSFGWGSSESASAADVQTRQQQQTVSLDPADAEPPAGSVAEVTTTHRNEKEDGLLQSIFGNLFK